MGILSKLKSFLVGAVTIAPAIAGCASPFIKRTPTGRTILQDILSLHPDTLYDAREVFTGVDANGKFQSQWVTGTYIPVFVGLGISKVIHELIKI